MRILQVTTHFSPNVGGVETHLDDLVYALSKRKNDLFVLTYKPLITKVSAKFHEKKNNIEILRIPWPPGLFYEFVKNPIVEFLYLFPGQFFVLPFIIFFWEPEVIQSHGLISGFVSVFWGKVFNKRVLTTTHSIYNFPKDGFYPKFCKLIFGNSFGVLTLSKQSKKEIVTLGVDAAKVFVFTYWVNLDVFKPSPKSKVKVGWQNKFVVLFVGRLVKEKGILVLLESVKNWNPLITLAIIGTGPLENTVLKHIKTINNIEYLGRIDNMDLPRYYSAADLLIVPSIHEEGFGRVILESLACGTAVLGANRGAIPEAIDNKVGELIEITAQNLKNKVEYYYKNPARLRTLSNAAREFAQNRYSEKNVKMITNAYEK